MYYECADDYESNDAVKGLHSDIEKFLSPYNGIVMIDIDINAHTKAKQKLIKKDCRDLILKFAIVTHTLQELINEIDDNFN